MMENLPYRDQPFAGSAREDADVRLIKARAYVIEQIGYGIASATAVYFNNDDADKYATALDALGRLFAETEL